MSIDEKRKQLLDLMHESKEVFNLKTLEVRASKERGIVQQTGSDVSLFLVVIIAGGQ